MTTHSSPADPGSSGASAKPDGTDPAGTMSTAGDAAAAGRETVDAAWISATRESIARMSDAATEADCVDVIRALEELKNTAAAVQARQSARFESLRRAAEAERGVPVHRQALGMGAEIALARQESQHYGGQHLSLARAMSTDLPRVFEALQDGRISERKAQIINAHTAWMRPEDRRAVDAALSPEDLSSLSARELEHEVRAQAQRTDPAGAAFHAEDAASRRRVTARKGTDGMGELIGHIPAAHAAAIKSSLTAEAERIIRAGDSHGRTRTQIEADAFISRLTGQTDPKDINIELNLIMTDEALVAAGEQPAWVPGFGPIAAHEARRLVLETDMLVFLRRLFTRPSDGQLVGMDAKSRTFTGLLRRLVLCRDDLCRTPWCGAPIRHIDHTTSVADGGATSYANAAGLCEACNYRKEHPGWKHTGDGENLTVTTPTGHTYSSRTRPLIHPPPGGPRGPDEAAHPRVDRTSTGPPGTPPPAHIDGTDRLTTPDENPDAEPGAPPDAAPGTPPGAEPGAPPDAAPEAAQRVAADTEALPEVIELPELDGEIYTRLIELGPLPGLREELTPRDVQETLRTAGWRPPATDVPPLSDDDLIAISSTSESFQERRLAELIRSGRDA